MLTSKIKGNKDIAIKEIVRMDKVRCQRGSGVYQIRFIIKRNPKKSVKNCVVLWGFEQYERDLEFDAIDKLMIKQLNDGY